MIIDRCDPINPGESDTVRIVMQFNEALALRTSLGPILRIIDNDDGVIGSLMKTNFPTAIATLTEFYLALKRTTK